MPFLFDTGAGPADVTAPRAGEPAVVAAVDAAHDGDLAAFAALYEGYVDQVFRFIYYRVGDFALAEDLTQDTFCRALRRIGQFEWQGKDFAAWLITIARNLVTDHFKSRRVQLERPTAQMLDADQVTDGPDVDVLTRIWRTELACELGTAIRMLTADQQACVGLRFMAGLSVAETAAAMGRNEGAVKTLQYRAMRTLQRLLPEGVAR